jgi:hypothetical protein
MSDKLRAHLANEIHRVDWKPLAAHAKRGGLVLVDAGLDLLEVAVAVATDDAGSVQTWMSARQLTKPTEAQVESWQGDAEDRFTIVIVQPYVLAQRDTGPSVS